MLHDTEDLAVGPFLTKGLPLKNTDIPFPFKHQNWLIRMPPCLTHLLSHFLFLDFSGSG